MHFYAVKQALFSLLALSYTLCAVQGYYLPIQNGTVCAGQGLGQEVGSSNYSSFVETKALLSKRTNPTLSMGQLGGAWGTTWSGMVVEPANSGWTEDTIDAYVVEGWKQTQDGSRKEVTLVAALWVRGSAVYLGSIPHGRSYGMGSDTIGAEVAFASEARGVAPLLWGQIKDRERTRNGDSVSLYHAEDMAMLMYERQERPERQYAAHSYMVTYGQRASTDKIGPKAPCGEGGEERARIDPSCMIVLRALQIEY